MPVAVPLIGAAITGVGGLIGKKVQDSTTKAAQQRSPEEIAAMGGENAAAGNLAASGAGLTKSGMQTTATGLGTMAPAASYFSTLLNGNRAAQSQATAAPRGAITDTYRGAEKSLEQSGVRGASADVAKGELARNKAGAISGLITGVQPGAANALTGIGAQQAQIGATQTGQGNQATQGAGSIYGNVLGAGQQNRQNAYNIGNAEGTKVGNAFGGFAANLMNYYGGKGSGGGSGSSSAFPSPASWAIGG